MSSAQTYITSEQLGQKKGLKLISELSGDPHGEQPGAKVQDAIDEASNLINARLRARYPDLSNVSDEDPLLADLNATGAILILYRDKPGGWGESHQEQWTEWLKELDKLSSGKTAVTTVDDSAGYGGLFEANPRVFGRRAYREDVS